MIGFLAKNWVLFILALIVLLLSGYIILSPNSDGFDISSSRIIIISTTLFIATLGLLTAAYHGFGLTNPAEALGLPSGSVRALIALFLLLAFVVMSLYIFQMMSQGVASSSEKDLAGVTTEEISALDDAGNTVEILSRTPGIPATAAVPEVDGEPAVPATPETPATYSIRVYRPLTDTASQLALQIFTVLATLVGTISGFYFGTRSLEAAGHIFNPSGGGGTLAVSNLKPNIARKETNPFATTVLGQSLAGVTSISLLKDGIGTAIKGTIPNQQNQTALNCNFNLMGAAPGDYDLLVRNAETAVVLNKALTITP